MSQQNALDACSRADLLSLKEVLSAPSIEVDNGLIFKLLIIAIQNKNPYIVQWLLDTYDISHLDPSVWYAAAAEADIGTIDLLYAKYPSCMTEMVEDHARGTILGLALYAARPKAFIQHLLDLGSDAGCVDAPFTPLGLAAGAYETPDVLELLINHGAVVKRSSALAQAAQEGRMANIKYLFGQGADINDPGKRGVPYLPLHTAVKFAEPNVVRLLLEESPIKADFTLLNHDEKTVWDLAHARGNSEILSLVENAQK